MPAIQSLGLHVPSGVSHLVEEGILPEDPAPTLYTWQVFEDPDSQDVSDELVVANPYVVWSRGERVYRVFSFEVEKEAVQQALFASFARNEQDEDDTAGGATAGSIRVKKRKPKTPLTPQDDGSIPLGLDVQSEANKDGSTPASECERALVVVLKSHMQIFFLSGARSIVPLNFDVDRVFAAVYGLVLQRKAANPAQPLQQSRLPPKTPLNSFALTQSFVQSPGSVPLPSNAMSTQPQPAIVKSLWKATLSDLRSQTNAHVPLHYHLPDPLSDLGTLGQITGPGEARKHDSRSELFPRSERLIFLSSESELKARRGVRSREVLLAVSVNTEKRQLNVWQASKPQAISYWKPRRRVTSYDLDKKKRRRSSQPGTGTATPNPRHSIGPRESYLGAGESFAGARDVVKDDGDLAAKLDPAFQNPRAPGPNTRRISSMLARSDLTGSDIFTENTTIPPINASMRRGPSLGAAGATNRSFRQASDRFQDLRSSIRSDHGLALPDDSSEDDKAAGLSVKQQFAALVSSNKGMRIGLQMRLLQSIDVDDSISSDLDVVTSASDQRTNAAQITLSIVNRPGRELLLFQIAANAGNRHDEDGQQHWRCEVTAARRIEHIIDACSLQECGQKSLTFLSRTDKGSHELSLQSPGSAIFELLLPSRLLINFPYDLNTSPSQGKKRSTGPRRLIDDLAVPLKAVSKGPGSGQLIVTDGSGANHRIRIRTRPRHHLVRRCLDVCQAVALRMNHEADGVMLAWWEILQYIEERGDAGGDLEWTAFVILAFSLCRPINSMGPPSTPVRTTRKKGGLLRSSSGASTDLTDFHAMVAQESGSLSALPSWMENPAWQWASDEQENDRGSTGVGLGLSSKSKKSESEQTFKKSDYLIECLLTEQSFGATATGKHVLGNLRKSLQVEGKPANGRVTVTEKLLKGLHTYREELKLNILEEHAVRQLTPVLAQLGGWMGWPAWSWRPASFYTDEDAGMVQWCFEEAKHGSGSVQEQSPPSILSHIAQIRETGDWTEFPSSADMYQIEAGASGRGDELFPKLRRVLQFIEDLTRPKSSPTTYLRLIDFEDSIAEKLPEGIAAPLRSWLALAQSSPPPSSSRSILQLLDRNDLAMLATEDLQVQPGSKSNPTTSSHRALRDFHTICRSAGDEDQNQTSKTDSTVQNDRLAVTRMIFKEDQRVREATRLLHPLEPPVVRCAKEPGWSEQEHLEAEQELAKVVAVRTLSVCAGRGLFLYGGRSPLLTERFPTHGFTLSCSMRPSGNNVTAEKEVFTEEKVSWAFFHAGAEAGLSISKNSKGIDTSWIVFNKPPELNNRHAGFLLALGLNGHLKNIAKWVAFKYLTPKHTMTSIGLLLGLAASYLGTMDTLVIRLLSVHVTRMLPPGAAELNLSPLTQTTGILALGLLYCQTQHRRMSEIVLSEMESTVEEVSIFPLDDLRDEGYRLAAGFALGFINLAQGRNLHGLHDMRIIERLLALAVSTKQVDLVHVLDKASAAATIAIALIFMRSEDEALAKKIDIPDTVPQFEYVRPDLFLLRTIARHMIMWNRIKPSQSWVTQQLPMVFRKDAKLDDILTLDIKDLPLYNTVAGVCFAIGLRFAGTANTDARDLLIAYLDQFMRLTRLPTISYDHRLTRTTVRNCQDATALAAACVMAGTGDIALMRRLRSLHGRIDPDTPYGSHVAAHQAIGTLFLAGGTHTFKSTNVAIASLLCAFYPLFPTSVLDNKGHLQAFRHLWVLATEPRCLVVRSAESHRPLSMPVSVKLTDGSLFNAAAPCLLPPIDRISSIELVDPRYWRVVLDLAGNAVHRAAFGRHQSMFARRKGAGAYELGTSAFSIAMQALADEDEAAITASSAPTGSSSSARRQEPLPPMSTSLEWIFDLPSFASFGPADRSLALPPEIPLANHAGLKTTPVDDRLMLRLAMDSRRADRLWSLRALFAWADDVAKKQASARQTDGRTAKGKGKGKGKAAVGEEMVQSESQPQMGWLEREVVSGLKAELGAKIAEMEAHGS